MSAEIKARVDGYSLIDQETQDERPEYRGMVAVEITMRREDANGLRIGDHITVIVAEREGVFIPGDTTNPIARSAS